MLGHAELLLMADQLPESAKPNITVILEQGRRGAQLVRQVLDFSRRSLSDQGPLNMSALVTETSEMLRRVIPESIQVACSCSEPNAHVKADPTQIQQVLTNLAVNARDAMPDGGRLDITTRSLTVQPDGAAPVLGMAPGDWVLVAVADTGAGMPPEVLDRVYEPFFSTKETGKGTGLGLSQVYGIVQLHNGFLHIDSEPGQGTTISLYLPATAAPAAPSTGRCSFKDIARGQGEAILYVEDEGPVREVIADLLGTLNYRPVSASSGEEALRLHEEHKDGIVAVISDLVMPGMGGVELCRQIRARSASMPIMLMSGYPMETHAAELAGLNVNGWLMKPADLPELARQVARLVALGRAS